MAIALFFTPISYVPEYRIEGPETFSHIAEAAQASSLVCSLIGVLFFLKNWRTGWPWLVTTTLFFVNGSLQMLVGQTDRAKPLTVLVASIGRMPAFALCLMIFQALLWVAWRVQPGTRTRRGPITEPTNT